MIKTSYAGLMIIRGPGNASFSRDGKVVATARKVTGGWALRIPGHLWPVTEDMPTARFNKIPGDKITITPVKGFKSWQAAAKEVARVTEGAVT